MKSSYMEYSNCMQDVADEPGNSSSGLAPDAHVDYDKEVRRDLYLRKQHLLKRVRKLEASKAKWEDYSCQAAIQDTVKKLRDYTSKMMAVKSMIIPERLFFHLEGLISLYFSAVKCTDASQAIFIASLYCQRYYTKSITTTIVDALSELAVENQAGASTPDWLSLLKEAKDNWKMVICNEGFAGVSKVLSIMLSLGLCDSSSLNYTIAGMRLFSVTATKKQSCAIDLIDAIFETVIYFVEGGYQCFMHGSMSPLLQGDFDMRELETRIAECERNGEFAKTGDLEKRANMTVSDFDTELCDVIEKLSVLQHTATNDFMKRLLKDKLDKLRKIQTVFYQTRVQGGLREAPFAMLFYGGSGVGKSCVANILMITTLMFNGYKADDDRIVYLNAKDKFMPNMRTNINGIHCDEIGNTKAQFVETSPTDIVLELINNVRAYARMAEVEMKGKVALEPKVVCLTSNVKSMCAEQYSNEPASITRRAHFTATVAVKPYFENNGMLDYRKVLEFYGGDVPFIPDLWDITLEQSFPIGNPTPGRPAMVGYKVCQLRLSDTATLAMKNVGIDMVIRYANQESAAYFANQKNFVARSNNLADKLVFCPECRFPGCMCKCNGNIPSGCFDKTPPGTVEVEEIKPTPSNHQQEPKGKVPKKKPTPPPHRKELKGKIPRKFPPAGDISVISNADSLETQQASNRPHSNQAGEYMCKAFMYFGTQYFKGYQSRFDSYLTYIEKHTTDLAINRLEWLMHSPYTVWTNWVPTAWVYNEYFGQLVLAQHEQELRSRILSAYAASAIMFFLAIVTFVCGYGKTCYIMAFLAFYVSYNVIETEKARLFAKIRHDNASMPDIFRKYRDQYISYICGISMAISLIYVIVQAWKFSRWVVVEEQGNLAPTSMADIDKRDKEAVIEESIKTEMNWSTVQVSPIPCNEVSTTTTEIQLEKKIFNNLAFLEYVSGGKTYACDIFFVCSNVALIPNHFWLADDMHVNILRKSRYVRGPNFPYIISKAHSVKIPNHDLSMVWVASGGDWTDLTEYFPLDKFRSCPGKLCYKKLVGEEIVETTSDLTLQPGEVGNAASRFYGASYNLQFNTFVGLCMAVIMTRTKQTVIAGFHLGGKTNRPEGVCGTLLYREVADAIIALDAIPSVLLSKSKGTLPKILYGVSIVENQAIHPKSPVNTLPNDAHVEVYGMCPGRATYYSDVEKSEICDTVEEVCGVTNNYGKPKFHLGKAWKTSLDVSCRPSIGVEGTLLATAVQDYTEFLIKRIEQIPDLRKYIRPLTRMETICGIDGVRFIDKMPPNTSIGAPLSGAKSKFLTLLPPEEYPDFACPAELDGMFWDHFGQCKQEFLQGRRVYFLFKACLKDEPTKITKDKVRVFQAAPVVLQLFVRMYYLPIVRLLSLFPLDSECGVGINTVGPEFHDLVVHMRKYGEDRILAGDYSKYDLRMPAQLIFAAFDVLIQIARHFGYSQEDLDIMKGIATEIAYPLIMYNGDLIQHFGSNPSGQNLTVYINSIVNSLLMRSCFYSMYPATQSFREAAAMMTYGDDVKGSVSERFDDFNHLSYTKWLAEHDIVFTMPDKESKPTKYMKDCEADFLKRSNVYNPDLGLWQGALSEDSIFKSLFCNMRSKCLSKHELAVQNIDGALREWWFHGRSVYEARRKEMQQIAEKHSLTVDCVMLNKDYDWVLSNYCDRYDLPYPEKLKVSERLEKSVPPSADTCS